MTTGQGDTNTNGIATATAGTNFMGTDTAVVKGNSVTDHAAFDGTEIDLANQTLNPLQNQATGGNLGLMPENLVSTVTTTAAVNQGVETAVNSGQASTNFVSGTGSTEPAATTTTVAEQEFTLNATGLQKIIDGAIAKHDASKDAAATKNLVTDALLNSSPEASGTTKDVLQAGSTNPAQNILTNAAPGSSHVATQEERTANTPSTMQVGG